MLSEEIKTLRSMSIRDAIRQTVALGLVVSSALIVWKIMMVVANAESPIVVVLSGSMEPGYHRGDLLLLNLWSEPIQVGDICVYRLEGKDIPIVHRVHRVHENKKGDLFILTKGDNNPGDDRGLYNPGQEWIGPRHLMGRSKAYLPNVGMLTIWITETYWLRYVVVGILGFFVLSGKENSRY